MICYCFDAKDDAVTMCEEELRLITWIYAHEMREKLKNRNKFMEVWPYTWHFQGYHHPSDER